MTAGGRFPFEMRCPGETTNLVTYEPDNAIKQGYLKVFFRIFQEIACNRWLIYQLFKRDFLATYKQSLFGVLWAVIIPVISVSTFVALDQSGVLNTGSTKAPYPVFAVSGIALWQLFAAGLVSGANSLVKAGPMVAKINFSKKSLVIAATGQAFVAFGVQVSFLLLLFPIYGWNLHVAILFLPVLVIPTWLLTLGLALIFAILNGIVRDIGNAISIFVTFLMLMTPVLYVKPDSGFLDVFSRYNPMFYLVNFPRDLILFGESSLALGFFWSAALSGVTFLACVLVFHLTESRVAERI
jgi:lipopolysaccharide transport system permease protein